MKAWIAIDGDGEMSLYFDEPEWDEDEQWWISNGIGTGLPTPDSLCDQFPMEPGYCQQIELDAKPVGEARKGEA